MLLSGRTAIITGGAKGIGRGIAKKFAKEGCNVVIVDLLEEKGAKTAAELEGKHNYYLKCDVTDSHQISELIVGVLDMFGTIDILVNNAGIAATGKTISEITEKEWDRILAVNLKGTFLMCKAVVPHMKEQGNGKVINISSLGAIAPQTGMHHYSASKAGILGLTASLALELAPFQICVNSILPGPIRTDIWDHLIPPETENREAIFSAIEKKIAPIPRMGNPVDVAGAALFFASNLSDYITGDRIIVGGGLPLRKTEIDGYSLFQNVMKE